MKRRVRAMTASGFLMMVGSVACDKGPMQHSRVRTSRRPHARVQSRTMPTQRPEFQMEYRLLESRSALSAIYENGFSVKANLLIPAPPVDGAAGPVSPSLLVIVAGVTRAARGGA